VVRVLVLSAALLAVAGGCAVTSHETGSKDMLFDREGVDIVTTSSARQMVMIKDPGSVERYCRGPEPDASLATSGGLTLAVPLGMGSQSVGSRRQEQIQSLGGRNPAVLITRELLYRACELSMNLNADAEKTLAIYREFLAIAKEIAAKQTQAGTEPSPAKDDDASLDEGADSARADADSDDEAGDKDADKGGRNGKDKEKSKGKESGKKKK